MAYYQDYQDPNQGWYGDDIYGGYQEYGYDEQPYEEDTESQKLAREQEMIEAIESNRLYLRKIRKRCVQEDFADLEKTQMFLFEFLIESLEVNATSELGLVPEETDDTNSELVARVQFLDTPYLEIREKGERIEGSDSVLGQTEYLETVGNAGLQDAVDPGKNNSPRRGSAGGSVKEADNSSGEQPVVQYDTKWENASGKSLLFSKSTLEIIQGLDSSPVRVQVSRCVKPDEEEEEAGTCEPLGYALVRLPDHFNLSILQSCKPGVILPVSCVHRDTCELKNVFGAKKGELQVFVRLSCFGSVITTSFQSVGPERRYVFKPSPQPELRTEESDINRDAVLKPIVAEEEVAKGITMSKVEDVFQKKVVWKNNTQNCGCLETPSSFREFRESSLRMPRPSDVSLCRNTIPSQQKGKPFCDWHYLVTQEIKNNPGGNCGCLDGFNVPRDLKELGKKSVAKEREGIKIQDIMKQVSLESAENRPKPSRIAKMELKTKVDNQEMLPKVREKTLDPITGLGMQPEPKDCGCDCSSIRNSLAKSPMMKYTWEVK